MARYDLEVKEIEALHEAMKNFPGNVEKVINDVLHNEAGILIRNEILMLMPESKRHWKGKPKAAAQAKSLQIVGENLSVTVKSKNVYNYLWFADDGQNVSNPNRRAAGNQQFFRKGAEAQSDEIIDRCEKALVIDFGK